jgi:hypothetical protein
VLEVLHPIYKTMGYWLAVIVMVLMAEALCLKGELFVKEYKQID